MNRFEQQILAWQRKAEAAMLGTVKEASQDLSEEANTSRFRGGNTPVDLGFMINSFAGAVNSIPRGQGDRPSGYRATDFDMGPVLLAVNRVRLGDRLVLGWTARYAGWMEERYGFMRLAAQNWPHLVDKAARKVRREIG